MFRIVWNGRVAELGKFVVEKDYERRHGAVGNDVIEQQMTSSIQNIKVDNDKQCSKNIITSSKIIFCTVINDKNISNDDIWFAGVIFGGKVFVKIQKL